MFFDKFFRRRNPEETKREKSPFSFKAGQEVGLVKISKSGQSEIEVGARVNGLLTQDVEVGRPINIKDQLITSPVQEIRQENGRYFAVTKTSLYEFFPGGAQQKQPEQKNLPLGDEQPAPKPQAENEPAQRVEQIPSSELRTGQEITLTKLSKQAGSKIEAGYTRRGALLADIAVGTEIVMQGFMTSRVKEIRESNGRYYAVTQTSVYEITPQQATQRQEGKKEENRVKINPAEQAKERPPSISEVVAQIETNLTAQPESVRENWESIKKYLYKVENIQGKLYAFSVISSGDYKPMSIALVRGQNPTDPWKMRVFRYSDSDHQWKSLPALRWDGSYSKGDEANPQHHIAQSPKLHEDIYRALESLPVQKQESRFDKYAPYDTGGNDGRYENELEFKESYQTLKNKEWADYQAFNQWALKAYEAFLFRNDRLRKNLSRTGQLYQTLQTMDNVAPLKAFREAFDSMLERGVFPREPEKMSLETAPAEFRNAYDTFVGTFITRLVEWKPPASLIPDFSPANRKDTYLKTDPRARVQDAIRVEEYEVRSPEGDALVFAMAKDHLGRVFIDNIYDPRATMTDYGTLNTITQMGLLVYKSEDYAMNNQFGFPKEYRKPSQTNPSVYNDISGLWEKNPIIARYREELKRRGEL